MENMELRNFLEFGTKSVCSPLVSLIYSASGVNFRPTLGNVHFRQRQQNQTEQFSF